jgi:adenylyl-sulfate kinase
MRVVLWFTGLSGAGKTTISSLVETAIIKDPFSRYLVTRLDGDDLRAGLCRDLGFSGVDRAENIRRTAEVSALFSSENHIVIVALISPLTEGRNRARQIIESKGVRFIEVYIDTPLDVAEQRDVKGLYRKARNGELKNFTGIDSPYEAPLNPDISVSTVNNTPEQSAVQVIEFLKKEGII